MKKHSSWILVVCVWLRDNANDLNLTWMTRGQATEATEARTNPTIQIRKGWVKPGWYLRNKKLCLRNKKNFICHNRWAKQSLLHSVVTSAVKLFLIIIWIHFWPYHCLNGLIGHWPIRRKKLYLKRQALGWKGTLRS